MFDFSKLQGLFGNSGVPQQNYGGLFQQMAGRYGGLPQTPLQGMGLGSPFMTERPQQALPTQGFMPTRTNAMGPNAMAMMGMNPSHHTCQYGWPNIGIVQQVCNLNHHS